MSAIAFCSIFNGYSMLFQSFYLDRIRIIRYEYPFQFVPL